jgi:hypothetical protein
VVAKVLGAQMFCTSFLRTDTKLDQFTLDDAIGNIIAQV